MHNFVLVDAVNQEGLLINTLTSDISVITSDEKKMIEKWEYTDLIMPIDENEKKFYKDLYEDGFLVENDIEENKKEEIIMERCRKCHQELAVDKTGVVLVITYQCNFACPYCYEDAPSYEGNGFMSKEMVDKIFDIHKNKIDNIAFYGGEPFLLEAKEIIEYIISKAPNSSYAATTNGYYLFDYVDIFKKILIAFIFLTIVFELELFLIKSKYFSIEFLSRSR